MGVRGVDISNHQAGMDVERVVRENNIGFVFVLSNDGTFKNPYYQDQMAAARRGGAIAVPYVYLRTNVDQTFETFRQQEPTPGPAIVDVEDGSGGRAECDRMHGLLHDNGYSTPLLYWPDWYRKKVGSPSLAGLPPLWTSWYPDYVNRGFDQGLAMVPAWLWDGYGGLPAQVVQFTSSGRLSGYGGNLDLNYFPGSREELAALLGGDDMLSNETVPVTHAPEESGAPVGPDGVRKYDDRASDVLGAAAGHAWSAHVIAERIESEIAELKASGVPVDVRMSDEDRTAIVNEVRSGIAKDLAPLFDLARRLES